MEENGRDTKNETPFLLKPCILGNLCFLNYNLTTLRALANIGLGIEEWKMVPAGLRDGYIPESFVDIHLSSQLAPFSMDIPRNVSGKWCKLA